MWSLAGKRRIGVLVGDVALACLSVPIAVALRSNLALDEIPWSSLVVPSVFAGLAAVLALGLSGTHLALWRFVTIRDLAALLVGATASVLGYLALMFLWDRLASVARAVPVIQWLVLVVGMCGVRVAYVALARVGRQREAIEPVSWEPVLLVGGGRGAALMVELLDLASGGSWRPVGILDERLTIGRLIDNVPILGRVGDYRRVMTGLALRGMRPQRILVTAVPDRIEPVVLHRLLSQARADGVAVTDIGSLLGLGAAHDVAVDGDGSAREAAHLELQLTSYLMTKRLFDIVVSLVVLAATAPLLALGALALRASIGSPVLFHQLRDGQEGRAFVMVKFRTMRESSGADGCLAADELRTTWLGRVMRRSRFDELPQFWNVLIGNMSIVGPRPLVRWELAELPGGGVERSSVRPGITGWAQVHGGQLLDLSSKVALDLWYVRHASLALDARILLLTVRMVLRGESLDEHVLARVRAAHAVLGAG